VVTNLESSGGNLRFASNNGFATSDPRSSADYIDVGGFDSTNVDFVDLGPADHGSAFDFAFGTLSPGETRLFNIFYGSADSEGGALASIAAVGASLYSLGQNSDPGGNFPGNPATFIFAFGGVGGVEPGTSPADPILPFVPAPGAFEFPAPLPRRWYDPPFVSGFEYELLGGGLFTAVGAPPPVLGFGSVDIEVGGSVIGSLLPGEVYTFGTPVASFKLLGIAPLLDAADPGFSTAFPTYLDFSGSASLLKMTGITVAAPIPEPGSMLLLGLGAVSLIVLQRRRRSQV
jgi:hypothetical protein